MRPIVEESIGLLRASLPAGVALRTAFGEQPMRVFMDATQIQQVLLNLCTNAWHALQGGSGTILVSMAKVERLVPGNTPGEAASAGDHVLLCVQDDGCGMDAATLQRIFEPFFTTKRVGQGTGLGLSVVHGIVSAHGGTIEVESKPGQGSVFKVYLPLASPDDAGALSGWDGLAALPRSGQGQRVLYVDDDDVMGLLAERLLARMGYRVSYFQDPTQAMAAVCERPEAFDLVISDYNMPKLSGLALAKALRTLRPGLPVAISSGYLSDEDRSLLFLAGVREVVRKENTLEELGPAAERLLAASAAEQAIDAVGFS